MDIEKFLNPQEHSDMPLVSKLLYQLIDEKYRILLDESSDLMCITDRQGKFIYVNKKLADSLGYTKKEMLNMHFNDIISRENKGKFSEFAKEFLKTGKIKIDNFFLKTKYDGKVVGEMSSIAFLDNTGKYCGARSVFKDHTKLLAIEKLQKKYESMLEDGIDTLEYVILILDKDLKVKWASTSVSRYFGLDKATILGENMRELLKTKISYSIQQGEVLLNNIFLAYQTNASIESFEFEILPPGSEQVYTMEYRSYPIVHGDLIGGRIEIYLDITARKKSEEALEYYYKKIHAIMEHAVEGIVELRIDNTIDFVNKSFLNSLGYTENEMLNRDLCDFILPAERGRLVPIKLIRKAQEITFMKKDSSLFYGLMSSIRLVFGTHEPHALCFISDITENKMAQQKLKDANLTLRALNDALLDVSLRDMHTGAYNYRYLNERLTEEIKRARRYFRPFSLIMIDIDFFKTVNDAYGHIFGDVVLREFTQLLKKNIRDTDVIIRSGGEEFVIFLSETETSGAVTAAQKIVKAVNDTFLGDDQRKVNITISLGIVSYPESGILDSSALMDAADQAMYKSKAKGRNMITVYNAAREPEKTQTKESGQWSTFEGLKERLTNISARNEESVLDSMMPMVREVAKRQGYPADYLERLLENIELVAFDFSLSEKETQSLKRAAMLCNLGFLYIPPAVLAKAEGKFFTKDDRLLVMGHPMHSVEIVRGISFLAPSVRDILYHHERYDGKGYPEGLAGDAIPLGARIISVLDTFEALVRPRPYRPEPLSKAQAIEIVKEESGKQFDPAVVARCLRMLA